MVNNRHALHERHNIRLLLRHVNSCHLKLCLHILSLQSRLWLSTVLKLQNVFDFVILIFVCLCVQALVLKLVGFQCQP